MIAELLLVGAIASQTVEVQSPNEVHQLVNVSKIETQFYVTARFPNGYETKIPCINNILPRVRFQKQDNRNIYVLDYGNGVTYDRQVHGNIIAYGEGPKKAIQNVEQLQKQVEEQNAEIIRLKKEIERLQEVLKSREIPKAKLDVPEGSFAPEIFRIPGDEK